MSSREQKFEVTADLFQKMNSINCEHVVVNPNIDSPYDHYVEFLQKVNREFTPEQISRIIEETGIKPSYNGTIPLDLVSSLAFSRLKKLVNQFKDDQKAIAEGVKQPVAQSQPQPLPQQPQSQPEPQTLPQTQPTEAEKAPEVPQSQQ